MSRKNKECFAEFIPWCPTCGELLETDHRWTREDNHTLKCECGEEIELEAMIVFTVKSPKPKEEPWLSFTTPTPKER